MDWESLGGIDWATLIDWLTDHIDDSSESTLSDWHIDWSTSVNDTLSSDESLSGVESDGSHVVASKMLGDLKDESVASALDLKSIENWWELSRELHIDDGTNDGGDLSVCGGKRS